MYKVKKFLLEELARLVLIMTLTTTLAQCSGWKVCQKPISDKMKIKLKNKREHLTLIK